MVTPSSRTESRRLVKASATGVLGEYTHKLDFGEAGDFAIIYGPNGVGKTRFLEVIDALANLKISDLETLPFEAAMLEFSDGSLLSVAHETRFFREIQESTASESLLPDMWAEMTKRFGAEVEGEPVRVLQVQFLTTHGDEIIPEPIILERQDSEVMSAIAGTWSARYDWMEVADLRNMTARERYTYNRRREARKHTVRKLPDQIEQFAESIDVRLIETQRLLTLEIEERAGRKETTTTPTIEAYSLVVRKQLAHDLSENSKVGQRLDSTFPRRMMQAGESSRVTEDEIRSRLKEQSRRRSRIEQISPLGLNVALPLPEGPLSDGQRTVLELYLKDSEDKLETFTRTIEKIDLLEKIVNDRLLGKRLSISAEDGIRITRNRDGERIPLTALSSGEQHEIILFFDLLFNVERGGLVLIDEPEISLHIAWQQKFIDDVLEIARLVGFQFVIATHSPQIIGGFWAQAQRLGPKEHPFGGDGSAFDA